MVEQGKPAPTATITIVLENENGTRPDVDVLTNLVKNVRGLAGYAHLRVITAHIGREV